ncbi:hypothetical protein BYT27DRAFT_7227679 [Phlegmacium glaucopus]|nr:hypothetical protein BYT27DRAFT_7227679 [Phlegmacium glaucopus]
MDDRLIHNPHLEVMPDHAGPHYHVLRDVLTQNGITPEQAIIDDAAAEEVQRQQQLANEPQVVQEPPEREEERGETEKKKPKMKDFDDSSFDQPQYTLCRIEDFKYIELWYLTPEGCTDVTQHQHMQNDNAFGLTKVDDMVMLKSISFLKASRNVVPDMELSFCQMSMVKNAFISLMTKYQWSDKVINAFAQLFTQLELHPYRQWEFSE